MILHLDVDFSVAIMSLHTEVDLGCQHLSEEDLRKTNIAMYCIQSQTMKEKPPKQWHQLYIYTHYVYNIDILLLAILFKILFLRKL